MAISRCEEWLYIGVKSIGEQFTADLTLFSHDLQHWYE